MLSKLVYEYGTHSLYYEDGDIYSQYFSLALDTLEMLYKLENGRLIGIQGFFPLVNAVLCNIELPTCERGDYYLSKIDFSQFKQGEAYDFIKKSHPEFEYFKPLIIRFDKEKGIIQIGETLAKSETGIKVSDNVILGCDNSENIKAIYIIPSKFI